MASSPLSAGGAASGLSGSAQDSRLQSLRTLALVGPAGSGKTTLCEALLLQAGAIKQAGSVEKGNTVSDHEALERRMQHSLQTSAVHLDWQGLRLHVLDTPGAPDFIGQALPALEAVESAVLVLNAQAGLELMATRLMEVAAQRERTRLVVINKIDAPEVDLPGLLALLPELAWPALPIHALSPQRDAQPAKVRHAIAALRQFFQAGGQTAGKPATDPHRETP